jgi:PAS domain S-box-containing protein
VNSQKSSRQNESLCSAPLSIALIYAAVGALWILLSDYLLAQTTSTPERILQVAVWKGLGFVAATAILIYLLVSRAILKIDASRSRIQQSEDRLRHLVEGYDEYAMIMLGPKGEVASWSPGAAKMTGYEADEIMGRPVALLYPPEAVEAGEPDLAISTAAATGQFQEESFRQRKDGSRFISHVSIRPLRSEAGDLLGFSSISRDITEEKNSQNKIFHLNRLYALLSRVNTTIVRTLEQEDLFSEICRTVVEEGKFVMAWIGLVDREKNRVTPVAWHGKVDGYLENLTITLDDSPLGQGPIGTIMKTGTNFVCNDIEHNPYMKPWRDAALKREYRSMAAFPIRLDGQIHGTLAIYSTDAFFFDSDEVILLDEVAGDITYALHTLAEEDHRRRAEEELRRLNDELELRVSQRTAELELANSELESFNYSVSHDLRSPLTVINGFSQTLLDECGADLSERGRFFVDRIKLATNRMAKLIDDLLNLTRVNRKTLQKHHFNLSAIAESVVHDLCLRHPRQNQVAFTVEQNLETTGDQGLVRLVLVNLLGNAWKYTAPKPEPRVEFGMTEKEGRSCFFVRDNGVGFDMAYSEKLFKPFERLHSLEDFDGSGIGLATVKRIISRHGGVIWAEAAPGEGATFYFTFS